MKTEDSAGVRRSRRHGALSKACRAGVWLAEKKKEKERTVWENG